MIVFMIQFLGDRVAEKVAAQNTAISGLEDEIAIAAMNENCPRRWVPNSLDENGERLHGKITWLSQHPRRRCYCFVTPVAGGDGVLCHVDDGLFDAGSEPITPQRWGSVSEVPVSICPHSFQ